MDHGDREAMSPRPIIDAGPGLNFLSINKERLLIGVLGPLSAPETVQDEVLRKARADPRFRTAGSVWRKLTPRWIQVLSDDETPELAVAVRRMTQQPMQKRMQQPKDLGEIMVVAHAVVAAEAGAAMSVLIDDGAGARIAAAEIGRLRQLHAAGQPVGSIRLVSTLTVLQRAAGTQHIPDRAAMRDIYQRLRGLDDGLQPIEATSLLSPGQWV
ncbi:hypothetical protein O7621_12700 [Solwaraspora sp. WMMD937]|uniref:hypothetical protein n=1 Tax=Solwaraspora sp. WMMD937 TaxID=3016090 RepID=UPI00249B29B2|nr:hypothetical protein [Solwaraspora sp. WMMD937]WFE24049.1 hypothetical protein O7621_12700 [Solwaraspora sp. WMMD937]